MAAPPEKVWALISDVTQMGRWSPECTGGSWIGGATGPAVGASFKGTNKKGVLRWSTTPTVTECEPGRSFVFEAGTTRWRYDLSPAGGGTEVTESFEEFKQAGAIYRLLGPLFQGKDREGVLRRGMEETLRRIKEAAERP